MKSEGGQARAVQHSRATRRLSVTEGADLDPTGVAWDGRTCSGRDGADGRKRATGRFLASIDFTGVPIDRGRSEGRWGRRKRDGGGYGCYDQLMVVWVGFRSIRPWRGNSNSLIPIINRLFSMIYLRQAYGVDFAPGDGVAWGDLLRPSLVGWILRSTGDPPAIHRRLAPGLRKRSPFHAF